MPPGTPHADDACGHRPGGGGVGRSNRLRQAPISRWLAARLRKNGRRVAVIPHPMHEPYIAAGGTVFAGVDYGEIVPRAAAESDIIVWDGGDDDFPFVRPDLHIVVDALRPEDPRGFHPGEAVLRTADVIVVNKVNSADAARVQRAEQVARAVNRSAPIVRGALPITRDASDVAGRRVLVVEDRPTITHGTMPFGAGLVAASAVKPAAIVDPRPFALGDEVDTPIVRPRYEVAEVGEAGLGVLVDAWLARGAAP